MKENSMKISNIMQKAQVLVSGGEAEKRNAPESYNGNPLSQADDSVNISSLINQLNHMMTSKVATFSTNEKISDIKSNIDSGTYSVSGMAVAAKMLGYGRIG